MRRSAFTVVALTLLSAGCIHYQAKPISPEDTASALAARSLDDPGLAEFLAANHEAVPAPGATWGLRALTLAAFYFSPDLDIARAEVAAAQAAEVTAGGRANPAISPSVGYNTNPPPSVSPWILGFNLEIPLTTAGKRRHRMDEAARLSQEARFKLATVAWTVRSRVRAALVELFAATQREALLANQETILTENASLLDRQLEAGEISPFEATQGHLAARAARLARQDAAASRLAARGQLASALGLPVAALADAPVGFKEIENTQTEIPAEAARREALLNRPDVLGALAAYEASQEALAVEIARQYPDITLGPGYEFDQGANKWFLALSLPLPLVNRNQGPIAEAEAHRQAAAARFTAVQADAMGQIDRAVQAYDSARNALATATGIGAELQSQEKAARARFEAGEISRLELGTTRLEQVTAELARLDAQVKAESALGQLEDAMQSSAEPSEWSETPPGRREPQASKEHGQ